MDQSKYPEGDEQDLLSFDEIGVIHSSFSKKIEDNKEFESFFNSLNAIHFKAYEFSYLGSSHYGSGNCASLNQFANNCLWGNLTQLVPALDAIREDLGHPIRLTSVYRNKKYNSCVGGVTESQHLLMNAADCVVGAVDNLQLFQSVLNIRRSGMFKGGVGLYGSFVHVDVRGENTDWVGASALA